MRIALFANGFPERDDGSFTPAVIDTLRRLSEKHEICVFALGGMQPAQKKEYRFDRMQVFATGSITFWNCAWKAAGLLQCSLRLHREQPFHLAHGIWHVGSLAATFFGTLAGCPVVLSMLGGEAANMPAIDYGVVQKRHWRWILNRCFRNASAITAGSRYYVEKISTVFPDAKEKLMLAPLGIHSDEIPLKDAPPNDEPRLLNVAALQPVKNIPQVLQTVRGLESRRWHLSIAGNGPLETAVRSEIARSGLEDFIDLVGWQRVDVFKQQLTKYDLLISLSFHEAQGMAMLECAAAGLPIVATRVGVAEELANLGAAIVFVDEHQDALAALTSCLHRLADLQQQARAAADKIRAEYDLAVTTRRFEGLYEQLALRQTATWHLVRMPMSMKLRRIIRPLVFRLALPILKHRLKKNADAELEGMKLRTNLDVFHPKYFFSSRILGGYLAECIQENHRVLDMGTGSGVVGIMAAKRGAQVLAVDINPAAVTLANANAFQQNLNGQWRCFESDLFARLDPVERFDWIAFNPPFFSGPVRQPRDAAWYAGENYDTIERFLSQARGFLEENGRIVLVVSSDMPLASLDGRFQHHGYRVVDHQSRAHLFEIFHLIQLGINIHGSK
jgi:release factor glutamine methyltransferase